jgi:hypothetical protein
MLLSLYIGMTVYQKGLDHAFGGAFAPVEPANDRDEALATHLTAGAGMASGPTDRERRVWVTDAVREKVSADLEKGARRRGR